MNAIGFRLLLQLTGLGVLSRIIFTHGGRPATHSLLALRGGLSQSGTIPRLDCLEVWRKWCRDAATICFAFTDTCNCTILLCSISRLTASMQIWSFSQVAWMCRGMDFARSIMSAASFGRVNIGVRQRIASLRHKSLHFDMREIVLSSVDYLYLGRRVRKSCVGPLQTGVP